jgi:hypothetical protein
MIWQQAVTGFVWVLALNRWLYEREAMQASNALTCENTNQQEHEWTPVMDQDGEVR